MQHQEGENACEGQSDLHRQDGGAGRRHRVDPQSGYRYYSIHQNARLEMIAYMKELGMSLSEIADVLRREDISLIEHILSQKNEQLHQQMRELQARHEAVERAIASIERYRKSPTTGTAPASPPWSTPAPRSSTASRA